MSLQKITPKILEECGYQYIDECLQNKKEQATANGIIHVKDRHIPTIEYFLKVWMPLNVGKTIARSTYYEWLNKDADEISDTIKKIDELFKALAIDIVANEGKGIFYAKNRLGMSDKQQIEQVNLPKVTIEIVK